MQKPKKKRSIFHWHRQIGLVVSLFVIILSVTGILLNHTEKFKLDSNYVKSEFLLKWYGFKKPSIKSYPISGNWLSHMGNDIYFNDTIVEKDISEIKGAVALENFSAIATQDKVILLTPNGEKIETLDATAGVPNNILAIGISDSSQLVLKTKQASYQANHDVTQWIITKNNHIIWSNTSPLPATLANTLNTIFRGKGLSKERVLLDLHSGRILGKAGPLLMDLAAILLLVLSFTGIWMYVKRSLVMYKRNKLLDAASTGNAYSAADLKQGEEAIVLTVIGDESLRQRLASMGVMAGTVISTPAGSVFGDPRTYTIRGYQLSMRNTEASMILLQTDEESLQHLEDASQNNTNSPKDKEK